MNADPIIFLNRAFLVYDENSAHAVMPAMRFAVDSLYFWPQAQVERVKDNARDQWRRRIKELGLEGLPDDPFAADEPEEKTMSKTREEKIRDLAAELRRQEAAGFNPGGWRTNSERWAETLLDAAEREAPQWPTDESVEAMDDIINDPRVVNHEKKREALGAAMSVDPVIRAAIEVARYANSRPTNYLDINDVHDLLDAIENAGLL